MPCTDHSECGHIEGQPVCDGGECVACTGTRYESCGTSDSGKRYVCDSLSRSCTQQERASAGLCESCVSDAHCGAGQLCVMQKYDEPTDAEGAVDVGYFCFWREDSTEPGAPNGDCVNARPYVGTRAGSQSIDGVEATICGLAVTTCAGYRDYRSKTCADPTDDAACGDERFASDGYCRTFTTGSYRCTTPCLSAEDCDSGSTCPASPPKFCSLQ